MTGAGLSSTRRRPGPEGWLGLVLVVTMSVLVAVASRMPPPQFEPVGSRRLAVAVTLVLGLLGVLVLVRDLRTPGGGRGEAMTAGAVPWLYALLVAYAAAVSTGLPGWLYLGLSTLFAGVAGVLICGPQRPGTAVLSAIVGLAISSGILWSFSQYLYVDIAG